MLMCQYLLEFSAFIPMWLKLNDFLPKTKMMKSIVKRKRRRQNQVNINNAIPENNLSNSTYICSKLQKHFLKIVFFTETDELNQCVSSSLLLGKKAFPHESHFWPFWPLWSKLICLFKCPARDNAFPHVSHFWYFWPLCTELICVFKSPARKNAFPHESHLWSFCPLCTRLICVFRFPA